MSSHNIISSTYQTIQEGTYQACAQMHLHFIAMRWMHLHLIHPHLQLHLIQMHLIESNVKQMRIKCHYITAVVP